MTGFDVAHLPHLLVLVDDQGTKAVIDPLNKMLKDWTGMVQQLVGAIGGLAFAIAFVWKIVATEPRSVMEAKRWIGRIVFGTLGVEMATMLVNILIAGAPKS